MYGLNCFLLFVIEFLGILGYILKESNCNNTVKHLECSLFFQQKNEEEQNMVIQMLAHRINTLGKRIDFLNE